MWDSARSAAARRTSGADLFETLTFVAAGKVKPKIETYPLARANEARERLQAGKVRYRAVLQHAAR